MSSWQTESDADFILRETQKAARRAAMPAYAALDAQEYGCHP